jgi:hypothetical protein
MLISAPRPMIRASAGRGVGRVAASVRRANVANFRIVFFLSC